jgi:recombinational DNA repair protein RecR
VQINQLPDKASGHLTHDCNNKCRHSERHGTEIILIEHANRVWSIEKPSSYRIVDLPRLVVASGRVEGLIEVIVRSCVLIIKNM